MQLKLAVVFHVPLDFVLTHIHKNLLMMRIKPFNKNIYKFIYNFLIAIGLIIEIYSVGIVFVLAKNCVSQKGLNCLL